MNQIKQLPASIQAEQSFLCACMIKPEIISEALNIIQPDDLYKEAHRFIFEAMVRLNENKAGITLASLSDALGSQLEAIGGNEYLTSLMGAGTVQHLRWEADAKVIKKYSLQRTIIDFTARISEQAYMDAPENCIFQLKEKIQELEKEQDTEIEDNQRLYNTVYHQIYEKKEPGLYTGIPCLKDKIYFEPGYIHAIAAESGVGKSAFGLQICDYISNTYGSALFYSLESTRYKLAFRQLARYSRVALTRINKSHFEHGQEEDIMEGVSKLQGSPLILIDNIAFQEVERLVAHTESFYRKSKISAIFIDFLQLMSSRKKHNTRHHEISYIVSQYKRLAKDLDIPVIFASQLRKDVGGRPDLDSLKESGDIRTLSDNILFLYAPSSAPTVYPVECFLGKGKEQERFSQWLNFDGNYQIFTEGEKPEEPKRKGAWQEKYD